MKTNILSIYFCSVLVICFFATQVNAQRVYGVRDSTVYVINSLDTIIAGKHKLYKKQGASLNLIKDLNHQGVTITDPNDPMAVRYRVNSPCRGCSVYLGTGVANPRTQTNNNGMGINFGLGFTMPFSP
jgi:hypothetical protein